MNRKPAFYSNHYFLISDDGDEILGVDLGSRQIMVGDKVRIKADCYGYIQPGITEEGYGRVVDITDDYTDHYFGVSMENGEFAHVKDARIAEVL